MANRDITEWLVGVASAWDIDLSTSAADRRSEIANKLFFIAG